MGLDNGSFFGNGFGTATAVAGTKIRRLVPPLKGWLTRISKLVLRAAGTAHNLTVLRPGGRTITTAAAAATATALPLAADPGIQNGWANALAANDLIAVRETDGVTRMYTVSAVPGSYPGNVTINALVVGCALGADVWDFGVEADTDPRTGNAHQVMIITASATTTYSDTNGGVMASNGYDEPLLLSDDNGAAAGAIDQVSYAYTKN